jgi:hypothetical protein
MAVEAEGSTQRRRLELATLRLQSEYGSILHTLNCNAEEGPAHAEEDLPTGLILYEETVAGFTSILGETHPLTLEGRYMLAKNLIRIGKKKEKQQQKEAEKEETEEEKENEQHGDKEEQEQERDGYEERAKLELQAVVQGRYSVVCPCRSEAQR